MLPATGETTERVAISTLVTCASFREARRIAGGPGTLRRGRASGDPRLYGHEEAGDGSPGVYRYPGAGTLRRVVRGRIVCRFER